MNTVLTEFYSEESLPLNDNEILRYAGAVTCNDELYGILSDCKKETDGRLSFKVCYAELDIKILNGEIDFGFVKIKSEKLAERLISCEKAIIFAATVGSEIDRLIKKYSAISQTKALLLQAIGSERVEALCELFCNHIKKDYEKKGYKALRRFSPGYGDLDLSLQEYIFTALDCPRKIGLTLNDSLIMSPSKSVTAIIGLCPLK